MARYKTKIGDLLVDVYEKSAGESSHSALFLPGFPATIAENFVTKLLNELGFCVLFPQYPGTYDSGGRFTPRAAIEATSAIVSGISGGEIENLKKETSVSIPARISVVVGYSFGAYVASRSLSRLPDVSHFLAVSPALSYGPSSPDMGFSEEGMEFLASVRRTRPLTYRLGDDEEWKEFYEGKRNEVHSAAQRTKLRMLAIAGEEDSSIDTCKLRSSLPEFSEQLSGNPNNTSLLTVADGGHSISSLQSEVTELAIREFVRT